MQPSTNGRSKQQVPPPVDLALKAGAPKTVQIDPADYAPKIVSIPVRITQISPLIVNNFNEKIKKQILDSHKGGAKKKKDPKDPAQLFEDSKYKDSKDRDCFPVGGIRNAMIAAARGLDGFTMTELKQAIFIEGPDGPDQVLLPIEYDNCEMREDAVRNDGGSIDIRIRAMYVGWRASFVLHVLENTVSIVQAFQLLSHAGFCVGLGEWRPAGKKGNGGPYGRFKIAQAAE